MVERPNLDSRRQQFLEYLRGLGSGDDCVVVPWLSPDQYHRPGFYEYARLMIHGRRVQAHRWVYEQVIGPVSDGMEVCHTCDNPPCVRPSHLWAGSRSQNTRDAIVKGRLRPGRHGHQPRGQNHWKAKLTSEQAVEIRRLAAEGMLQRDIAPKFGVSKAHISNVVRGVVWKDA